MLDSDTRRRIDTARDILVGKVPDPKSQVEQITIALIYKFMDDMDAEAEELGGRRKFFTGDFARYGWARLMRSGLGGHEVLNLYGEAIARMPENPGIPPLFREIFNNAYLPYRDPETLRAFLTIIDEFEYDHSERLGDAFEYLLSVLGSQGDAGQFRTPRHIIDFIVAVLDPKKDETVLDPACGTAGFLISSYKHILAANTDGAGHSTLTPDERGRLTQNFKGYDISPDMVRLSLVNLYLHGFPDPRIYEYDTLTSQERWNEYADVILANPPFMSPKGGIRPHNRFSVQSKRSEVLFVDYMAEHLTPNGRAGIIVPEGIIFQSQTAYKQLRKLLVEEYLVAVVSLPAGVFNPYSGVKTSILILDKALARQSGTIAFFKIEHDGFGLGAQRRPIDRDDLPQARAEIAEYLCCLHARRSLEDFQPTLGLIVPKDKIAANGDFNLSGERYRTGSLRSSMFTHVLLREVSEVITKGTTPTTAGFSFVPTGINFIKIECISPGGQILSARMSFISNEAYAALARSQLQAGDVLFSIAGAMGRSTVVDPSLLPANTNQALAIIRLVKDKVLPGYLSHLLRSTRVLAHVESVKAGVAQYNISLQQVGDIEIPLPPLEVQQEIVAEIEGYQKVIDGARIVIDNYRPHIPIHPDWPLVGLGELCVIERGASPRPIHAFITDAPDGVNWVKIGDAKVGSKFITQTKERISPEGAQKSRRVKPGDFILSNSMSFGRPYIMAVDGYIHDGWLLLQDLSTSLDSDFLFHILGSDVVIQQFERAATGGVVNNLNSALVRNVTIPLPPLATQRAIVAEIEGERALVAANRELIERFEQKVQATLARVWGEEAGFAAAGDPVDEAVDDSASPQQLSLARSPA